MSNPAVGPAVVTILLFLAVGLSLGRELYPDCDSTIERCVLGFALGSGLGTVLLFVSFLVAGRISYVPTLLVLIGIVIWSVARSEFRTGALFGSFNWPTRTVSRVALIFGVALTIVVLFRAVYWPFYAWDALSHWALRAQTTYQTGVILPRLPSKAPGQLHNQYPLWLPLAYDWVAFFNGDWAHVGPKLVNAAVFPAILGSTYLLGREAFDETTGSLSVITLSFTPLFSMFSSVGYADIPLAFFTTLAAYYGLRAVREDEIRHAFTAGVLAGLGGWTKIEGAITGVLFMIVLWSFVLYRFRYRIRGSVPSLLLAGVGFSLPIAPWYLYLLVQGRLGGGSSTFLTVPQLDPAHAFRVLVILAQAPIALRPYDPTGVLVLGAFALIGTGLVLIGWLILKRRTPFLVSVALVNGVFVYFVFYQTYHDLWFLLTSSAPRYLVHFEAVVVVLVVLGSLEFLRQVDLHGARVELEATNRPWLSVALALILVAGAVPISSGVELNADAYAVTHPTADTEEKYRYRFGATYDTFVETRQQTESGTVVYVIDNYQVLAHYFLPDRTIRPPFIERAAPVGDTLWDPSTLEAYEDSLRTAGIEYVVVAGPTFLAAKPRLQRQARFARESSALDPVWSKNVDGQQYVVYRVLDR